MRHRGRAIFAAMFLPGLLAAQASPGQLPARELVQQVYERLVRTAGAGPGAPKLRVQTDEEAKRLPADRRGQERVSFLKAAGPLQAREIVIDDRVLRLCQAMGARAEACIAYFLGHELAHYVNHHDWGPHFAEKMGGVAGAAALGSKDIRQMASQEAQADDLGLLYAALAGFDSFAIAPDALAAVYREYGISNDLPGYLSLTERQQIPRNASLFLQKLLPLFDAGALCMALGHFEMAASAYEELLQQFPSREIHNNAAVARARIAAVDYQDRYPWLLDGVTHLPAAHRRGASLSQPERDRMLQLAADHLDRSIQLAPGYAVAYVNRGLVALAQGEDQLALAEFDRAQKAGKDSALIASSAWLGRAITHNLQNRAADARRDLDELKALDSHDALAEWWTRKFAREEPEPARRAETASPAVGRSELWPDSKSPRQIAPSKPDMIISLEGGFTIDSAVRPHYRWFRIRFPGGQPGPIAAIVTDDASFAPNVLPIGSARETWSKQLGYFTADLPVFPSHAYLFVNLGLLLQVDQSERVWREIIFQ